MKNLLYLSLVMSFMTQAGIISEKEYKKCVSNDAEFTITKDAIKQGFRTIKTFSSNDMEARLRVPLSSELQTIRETVYLDEGGVTTGDGSSSNWEGFFNKPKSEKANALKNAVRGIGKSRANILVNKNAFGNKPRSWGAFINVLESYEAQHNGLKGMVSDVKQYDHSNKISLGYLVSDGTSQLRTETEVIRTREHSENILFELNIDTLPLEGEKESLDIESGWCDNRDTPSVYSHNRYYSMSQSTDYGYVSVTATRKQVKLPNGAFSFIVEQDAGEVVLKNIQLLKNSSAIKKDIANNGGAIKLSGSVECLSEKGSWWKGRSKEDKAKDNASKKAIASFSLDGNSQSYKTGIQSGCDYKVVVILNMVLSGSKYYNESASSKEVEKQL